MKGRGEKRMDEKCQKPVKREGREAGKQYQKAVSPGLVAHNH